MAAEALILEDAYQRGYTDAVEDMRKKKRQRQQWEQEKKVRRWYFIKQKACGLAMLAITVLAVWATEGDITIAFIIVPLGLTCLISKETVKKKRAEYGEGYYKKYAAGNGTKYYRVRKSWTDAASQLGAFTSLENAKSACKAGYTVYDDNGKAVYTAAGQQASASVPFSVQVDILDLNIRTGAGTNYAKTGETTGKGVFTIVEVKAGQGASAGWGRLKSGAGWISLDYATRLA